MLAPEPESVTDVPAQTAWSLPAFTVGKALTVMAIVVVVAQSPAVGVNV